MAAAAAAAVVDYSDPILKYFQTLCRQVIDTRRWFLVVRVDFRANTFWGDLSSVVPPHVRSLLGTIIIESDEYEYGGGVKDTDTVEREVNTRCQKL